MSKQKSQNETDGDPAADDESFTSSTQVRWRALASVLTLVVVVGYLAFVGAVAAGEATVSAIDGQMLLVVHTIVLAAVGWTYGLDLIDRWVGNR